MGRAPRVELKSRRKPAPSPAVRKANMVNNIDIDALQLLLDKYLPALAKTAEEHMEEWTWTMYDGPSVEDDEALKDQLWDLFVANMKDLYHEAKDPDIKWYPSDIQATLYHELSRLVIVQDSEGRVKAFSIFRFETREKHAWSTRDVRFLMYIFEMQVAEAHRGIGICRRMFTALESIARGFHADFIMLTCFKCNTRALAIYKHLGYKRHEDTNPTAKVFIKRFKRIKKRNPDDAEWRPGSGD